MFSANDGQSLITSIEAVMNPDAVKIGMDGCAIDVMLTLVATGFSPFNAHAAPGDASPFHSSDELMSTMRHRRMKKLLAPKSERVTDGSMIGGTANPPDAFTPSDCARYCSTRSNAARSLGVSTSFANVPGFFATNLRNASR